METQSPQSATSLSPGAKRRRITALTIQALIVAAVVVAIAAFFWVSTLPQRVDDQQTIVLGTSRLAPDSDASLRVVVQDFGAGKPIAGAQVAVSLRPKEGKAVPLFSGQTDETGSLPVQFHVPADAPGAATLVVETSSDRGKDRVQQPVTIQRDYRLLLSTDKPLYQPGQTIHMRALALSNLDMRPARGASVDFLVEDAKGNKVFRQTVTASDYGIAAADMTLATVVNQGNYKLSVAIGETRSEKTVEVKPYVLPKFAVQLSPARSFYLPGETVEGVVQADYFFGKPVAAGQVQIVGSVWDVERTAVVDLRGQTDEKGTFTFRFDLPAYLAGSGLESGQADFTLEVTVIDQAQHAQQTSLVLPIAEQALIIEAVPESGVLKPEVENVVYVLTSYPDGRPVSAQLEVRVGEDAPLTLETGEFGLAQFTFVPVARSERLTITARDATGLQAVKKVTLDAEKGSDHVLLRADRATYVVGETMHLVALTPARFGSVYLDLVKSGQTLSTRSTSVVDGKAEFDVDVSPDLYGTVELHAYKVLANGTIVRDTRLVVVDAPNELTIGVTADKEVYRPGETATIDLQTSDQSGNGVQSALGLAIVDESVFALQQQDPGFAKLYFMLEQELMEPFYQIKEFEFPAAIPEDEVALRQTQDDAAKAVWSGVQPTSTESLNSRQLKLTAVEEAQAGGFQRLGRLGTLGVVVVPLVLWLFVVVILIEAHKFEQAVTRTAVGATIMLGVAVPVTCVLLAGWREISKDLAGMFYFFLVIFAGGGIFLAAYGWRQRNTAAQFTGLLALAWSGLAWVLDRALSQMADSPAGLILLAALGGIMLPGVYLLFGQGLWVQEEHTAGATATGMSALAVLLMIMLPFLLSSCGAMMATPAQVTVVAAATPQPVAVPAQEEGRKDAPRLRQYFPETLYWAPEVLTDEGGFVELGIPLADSITTWRLTALASSQDGRLGFTTRGVRVFQDFFVDIDLPVALTVDDEISIPVGVYNYLPEEQQVRLEVQQEPWFDLLGPGEQAITIAANDITVVYFPIRVRDFGQQGFQVTAWGTQMNDAIRRNVQVVPNGKEIWQTESNWLREDREVSIDVPPDAIAGATYTEVKIYPGALAQVVEGLEKIVRLPHG